MKHISILDESLTEFEEERLSILNQLKALEEKLVRLGDEDEEFSQDPKLIANSSQAKAQANAQLPSPTQSSNVACPIH